MSAPLSPTQLVERARAVATAAHEGQFRRDGRTPFIRHPAAVAERVAGDPVAEAVAWLHDVVEDTPVTLGHLRGQRFPPEVIEAVDLLTRTPDLPYEEFVRRTRGNPLARKVKVADLLSNLADRPSPEQIVKYARALLLLHE